MRTTGVAAARAAWPGRPVHVECDTLAQLDDILKKADDALNHRDTSSLSDDKIVSGLKQGWAFAWRSLITAEMLYLSLGLGQVLMMGRDLNDMSAVIAVMFLIIAIGYVVDGVVFKGMERHLQNKWGLTPAT